MAKRANTIATVQITISTTRNVQASLEELVLSGLYGKNPAEAAERLLTQSLAAFIKDGTLQLDRDKMEHEQAGNSRRRSLSAMDSSDQKQQRPAD